MNPKKRGANYTMEEKERLRDLVTEYKSIVEDKRTGAEQLKRKREVWQIIALKYNSSATTGMRDMDALKTLYDNMKQKARKALAEKNKAEYMSSGITKEMLDEALQKAKEDKKQIKKTGGGSYTPTVTVEDEKILSIIKEQVEPLPNMYDSAAVYFKDLGEFVPKQSISSSEVVNGVEMDYTETIDLREFVPKQSISSSEVVNGVEMEYTETIDCENNLQIENIEVTSIKKNNLPIVRPTKQASTKKLNKNNDTKITFKHSAESLKKLYLKRKCQNAALERKRLMQDIYMRRKEHSLKIQALKDEMAFYRNFKDKLNVILNKD